MLTVNIRKKLGDFQLDVNFETHRTTLALLGSSGCGKSVTLKCIAGILRPDEGTIVLNGRTLYDSAKGIDLPPQKRGVGYLFQEYALFPNMTVEQNILTALRQKSKKERKATLETMLDTYRLRELRNAKPSELSGGQKQRTALARIMAQNPEVLLLDEPFSALDNYLKFHLELELLDTLTQFHGDVVFVSHSRNEVTTVCTDVCVLNHGKSEPKEPVLSLMEHPRSVSAALLSRCANFTPVTQLEDGSYYSEEWNMKFRSSYENSYAITTAGIRSGHVKLVTEELESINREKGFEPIDRENDQRINQLRIYTEDQTNATKAANTERSNTVNDLTNHYSCRIVRIVEDTKGDILLLLPEGAQTSHYLRMDLSGSHIDSRYAPGDTIRVSIEPKNVMLLTGDTSKR